MSVLRLCGSPEMVWLLLCCVVCVCVYAALDTVMLDRGPSTGSADHAATRSHVVAAEALPTATRFSVPAAEAPQYIQGEDHAGTCAVLRPDL